MRLLRLLARGLLKRCPRCGEHKVFRKWATLVERCPTCGMRFEREEGAWLGAVVVAIGASQLVVIVYIAVGIAITLPHPQIAPLVLTGLGIVTVFAAWFYPVAKTTWIAIELWLRSADPEDLSDVDR